MKFVVALLAAALSSGCAAREPPRPAEAPRASARTAPAVAPSASAATPAPLVVAADTPSARPAASAAPAAIAAPSVRGTLACGSRTCRAGKETCCSGRGKNAATRQLEPWANCVPTVAPSAADASQLLGSQLIACQDDDLPTELDHLARCDDSNDCRAHETCCRTCLSSDISADLCTRLEPGKAACELGETCRPDVPCRTRGTQCVDGTCVKASPTLRCGAAECSRAGQACCGGPPQCRPQADCEPASAGPVYRCAGPRDCAAGEHCAAMAQGTICKGLLDLGTSGVACDEDADCPRAVCDSARGRGERPVCAPDRAGWLKVCGCR
jgi:hypothetical protein